MSRDRHPSSEIEKALKYVESFDWRIKQTKGSGHSWGKMYCPKNDRACQNGMHCITCIWSTPRNPGNHAKKLKRIVDRCVSLGDDDE